MKIGITKNTKKEATFNAYKGWLLRFNPTIEFHDLAYEESQLDEIEQCDGLLLTGGGDIHPKAFGKGDGLGQTEGVDDRRDNFEFKVIEKALAQRVPVLGICRGMQTLNVYFGGSLHLDLESAGYPRHHEDDGKEQRHKIMIAEGTCCGDEREKSRRGQFISPPGNRPRRQGPGSSARSNDGVIEAMERDDKNAAPFLFWSSGIPANERYIQSAYGKDRTRFLEEINKHTEHS